MTPETWIDFAGRFGAIVLALRQHGDLSQEDLGTTRLSGGDSVLLLMDPAQVDEVRKHEAFVVVSSRGRRQRRDRARG